MKKILVIALLSIWLTGCNRTLIDTIWKYKYADIKDVGTIEVESWNDYDNSDMIQITAKDCTTYLTHSVNVVLRMK